MTTKSTLGRLLAEPRNRLAELVTAATYGTVLVLAALVVTDYDDVASGLGLELVARIGVTTWLAHLYAEVVEDHLRRTDRHAHGEIGRAMADGSPILLATLLPAVALVLGRVDVVPDGAALWAAVAIAVLQLMLVGGFVGRAVSTKESRTWSYAAATTAFGVVVVVLKALLSH